MYYKARIDYVNMFDIKCTETVEGSDYDIVFAGVLYFLENTRDKNIITTIHIEQD